MTIQTLPQNWLDTAASFATTKWLEQFVRIQLARLQAGKSSSEEFAARLERELKSRSLTTLAQQKNYRSNVVMALKQLDPNHPAIALVSLSTEEYRILNDEQKERVADRETRFITSETAELLVERATRLTESAEWADVGAGLAVLIGRRISEIVLSEFSLKSAWSLTFSQMAKKRDDQDITIEIPTLAPAEEVMAAIERLQRGLRTTDLKLRGVSSRQAKQRVNNRYSGAIADKCSSYFGNLVSPRSDKDNLYTHIFRAVYATIAAHWYCPPSVPEHLFKAEIQGHFSLSQDGKKLPNYAARSNYDDYAIGDGQGNRDGRLGIKLGQVKELQVIEAFRKEREIENKLEESKEVDMMGAPATYLQAEEQAESNTEKKTMTKSVKKPALKRPALYADDLERLTNIMTQRGVTGSPAEVFQALLDTFETELSAQKQQQIETVGEVAQTLTWFTDRINRLEQERDELAQERDRLKDRQTNSDEVAQLREKNTRLEQELQKTQSRLNSIQTLLGGSDNGEVTQSEPVVQAVATPVATKTASAPTTEATSANQRNRNDSATQVNDIIDAIIKWNSAQELPEQQLRISFPSVRSLAVLVGASYQPVIREVMKERAKEIDEIHERYMIGSRHNRSVHNKDGIVKAIARDYLGIDNWKDATYVN